MLKTITKARKYENTKKNRNNIYHEEHEDHEEKAKNNIYHRAERSQRKKHLITKAGKQT